MAASTLDPDDDVTLPVRALLDLVYDSFQAGRVSAKPERTAEDSEYAAKATATLKEIGLTWAEL